MKLHCDTLVFEVTRRCNMNCSHCMRGKAQCKDISKEIIDRTLESVESVESILFTGGEIALNLDAIKYILQVCKEKNVMVYNFYAVTNGKVITNDFVMTMCDWYCYVLDCGGDPEYCGGLALSSDIFHEDIPDDNVNKLRCLSFFREEDKEVDWHSAKLINLGNARSLVGFNKRDPSYSLPNLWYDEDDDRVVSENTITVTVDGDVLSDCDYEYESTDEIKIGSVLEENWVKNLLQHELCYN